MRLPQHCGDYSRTRRASQLIKVVPMLAALLLIAVEGRAQFAVDGFDPNPNGTVNVILVQPDGKVLVGGDITMFSPNGGAAVTRNRIARLNSDGTLDSAFDPNANVYINAIALQTSGDILAGGQFTMIGGVTRNYIARLNATTGLPDSFDPNANNPVQSIAVQADGKILVGGGFQRSEQHRRTNTQRHRPARSQHRLGRFV